MNLVLQMAAKFGVVYNDVTRESEVTSSETDSVQGCCKTQRSYSFRSQAWYKQSRQRMVACCEAMIEEGPADSSTGEAVSHRGSAGFRLMLKELLPRFRAALEML